MKKELEKTYNFNRYEEDIYKKWEDSGYFNPDNLNLPEDAPSYTIILPPPNITDKLHLGHSSMLAIEDLMIRYKRMNGYRALWVPGTDHAAIATQNVVEKKLIKEEGLSRHDLGREKFLEHVWKFLKGTQKTIIKQIKSMGASLDWSREAFTLDDKRVKAVRKMFVDMYKEGIIYRGERIVNWCPRCASTLADDEVEYKEQKAKLYTFKYSKDFPIPIATTRPETKLGDTAVAVNPKDERYQEFIGQTFKVNFFGNKLSIKVIGDWKTDMEFGTGAVGVTPAHSMADWRMAEEHGLDIVKVIDEEGMIKEGFGEFSNKSAVEARETIVQKLKENKLLIKEEEIENNLSVCYRCNTGIEPLPSKQWFVAVDKKLTRLANKSIKEKAIEVAENKNIKFIPNRFTKTYLDWMNNLHDWCISRQIWFGHRIPAWYCDDCGEISVSGKDLEKCPKCQSTNIRQDEDSLDTWYSSGMWTFSTLGWPDNYKDNKKSGDLQKFHPTQMLETGYEIITLWVSRMIMMSFFALGEIPFENVYLHGMVLDGKGKKMSKSKGNGIDPLIMINKFGTDAVRLSLLIGNTPGNDVRLSEEKIESQRNFVNKLWNISRYILAFGESKKDNDELFTKDNRKKMTASDKWISIKMKKLIEEIKEDIENYNFSAAGEKMKDFTWNDLADWYVEASKFSQSEISGQLLKAILSDLLRLWHPYIPFVTEKIWSHYNDSILMVEAWADQDKYEELVSDAEDEDFEIIKDIIIAIRNIRAENKIDTGKKIKVQILSKTHFDKIEKNKELILKLRTGIEEIEILKEGKAQEDAITVALRDIDIYIIGAIDKKKEKERIKKEIDKLSKFKIVIEKKLDNKQFINNAPEEIIEKEKMKKEDLMIRLEKLNEQINTL